jgi:nitrous oxidase accessory protein NosD
VRLADFVVEHREVLEVGRPVEGVSRTGFEVRGFPGPDIAVVGARNTRVADNVVVDGAAYGVITNGSSNTQIVGNRVRGESALQFIGICMDDLTAPLIARNRISGYDVGLCIQTQGAQVRHNGITDACIGVYIDPGIGATIQHKHVGPTNTVCPDENTYGIYGIILAGALRATVIDNRIDHQAADGIAIIDAGPTGPFASHNLVTRNVITESNPDLDVSTQGTGNVITHNRCTSSTPSGLCD